MNNSVNPNNNTNSNSNIEELNTQGNVNNSNMIPNGSIEQLNVQGNVSGNIQQFNTQGSVFNNIEQPSVQGNVTNSNVSINTVSNSIENNTVDNVGTQTVQNSGVFQNSQSMQGVASNQGVQGPSTIGPNNQTDISNLPPMKEVVIDPTPPKKGKYVMSVILFCMLLAIIYFLPDITSYVRTLQAKKQEGSAVITTGVLKCSLSRSSDNFDYVYEQDFSFTDSKLTKLTYTVETRGDMSLDEVALDEMNTKCNNLSLVAKQLEGVVVSCDLDQGIMLEKQVFDYSQLDVEEVSAAFVEAGGIYPDYENGEDIDYLEKNMNASGYSCERIK